MLKLLALFIAAAFAQDGAGGYLIATSQNAACLRSQQMCAAMKCDGVHTIWWWDCSTALQSGTVASTSVTTGSFAVRIDSGFHGATAQNLVSGGPQGLTASEQAILITPAQANGSTVFPWIISIVTFDARLTPPVVVALNNTTDQSLAGGWNIIKGAALVNLQAANVQTMVSVAVVDGIIPAASQQSILALSISAVNPTPGTIP